MGKNFLNSHGGAKGKLGRRRGLAQFRTIHLAFLRAVNHRKINDRKPNGKFTKHREELEKKELNNRHEQFSVKSKIKIKPNIYTIIISILQVRNYITTRHKYSADIISKSTMCSFVAPNATLVLLAFYCSLSLSLS